MEISMFAAIGAQSIVCPSKEVKKFIEEFR